jgi:hypothetical protein
MIDVFVTHRTVPLDGVQGGIDQLGGGGGNEVVEAGDPVDADPLGAGGVGTGVDAGGAGVATGVAVTRRAAAVAPPTGSVISAATVTAVIVPRTDQRTATNRPDICTPQCRRSTA